MRAHIPGRFRLWCIKKLHAVPIEDAIKALSEARRGATWKHTQQPDLHATVYVEPEPNPLHESNEAFTARNRAYATQIHTQHGLPAIRAKRVIPARTWVEQRKQQGRA